MVNSWLCALLSLWQAQRKRYVRIGSVAIGGAALLGVTGALVAPVRVFIIKLQDCALSVLPYDLVVIFYTTFCSRRSEASSLLSALQRLAQVLVPALDLARLRYYITCINIRVYLHRYTHKYIHLHVYTVTETRTRTYSTQPT